MIQKDAFHASQTSGFRVYHERKKPRSHQMQKYNAEDNLELAT